MFNLKALLFDSDGVVVDSEMARDEIMRNILLGFGVKYDRDVTKPKLSGKAEKEMIDIIIADYKLNIGPQELSEKRKEALNDLYQNKVDFVPGFMNLYDSLKENFCVYSDYRYKAKIAIVSGCEPSLFEGVDKRLKISELVSKPDMHNEFDIPKPYIFLSNKMGVKSKPSPDVFLSALQCMNVLSEDSVVFEDAPNGIAASLRAGVPKTVAITRTFSEELLRKETIKLSGMVGSVINGKVLFIPDYSSSSIEKVIDYINK